MSCDSTDNELKLAKEYKSLLSYIRPLIQQLDRSKGKILYSKIKKTNVFSQYFCFFFFRCSVMSVVAFKVGPMLASGKARKKSHIVRTLQSGEGETFGTTV